ncbi:C-5 cytosine-specific DNA methylase [compost metagenome]
MLVGRGLALVLGDLADMGYSARWGVIGAADLGAPHQRNRIWIVAFKTVANTSSQHVERILTCSVDQKNGGRSNKRSARPCRNGIAWWSTEPGMGRVADGVAYRVDRIKALGNGQVPIVATRAFEKLSGLDE